MFSPIQNYGITELLVLLGIKSEDKLQLIVNTGFRPMNFTQGGVKLNSLINIQESIIGAFILWFWLANTHILSPESVQLKKPIIFESKLNLRTVRQTSCNSRLF